MLFERIGNHLMNANYMNSIDKEKESFKDTFVNLNEYTNIEEWSNNKTDGYDEHNGFKKLLLDIMPTCYELAKKQTISSSINNIIKFYKTEKWYSLLMGSIFFPISYPIIYFSDSGGNSYGARQRLPTSKLFKNLGKIYLFFVYFLPYVFFYNFSLFEIKRSINLLQ